MSIGKIMTKDSLPDFSGKCISIRARGSRYSHDLYDPSFEYQGGKLFIVGTVPEGASESCWDDNQTCALDWENVIKYTLFDSKEAYQKAAKISDDFYKKKEKESKNDNKKTHNKASHKGAPMMLGRSLRSRPCQRRYTT